MVFFIDCGWKVYIAYNLSIWLTKQPRHRELLYGIYLEVRSWEWRTIPHPWGVILWESGANLSPGFFVTWKEKGMRSACKYPTSESSDTTCQKVISNQPGAPKQTWITDPMLFQCWSSVYDAGPTLNQHWVDVSSWLWSRSLVGVECLS